MRKNKIFANGTAYEVTITGDGFTIGSNIVIKKYRHLQNRHKSYVKWLKHIKATR